MRVFPRGNVLDRHLVIGIILHLPTHIDDHQRPHQMLRRNLVHRPRAIGKMGRRVEMRAVVLLGREHPRVIAVALDVPQFLRLIRRLLSPLPVRRAVVQVVREIDHRAKFALLRHSPADPFRNHYRDQCGIRRQHCADEVHGIVAHLAGVLPGRAHDAVQEHAPDPGERKRPADGHGGRLPGQTFQTKREAEDHEAKCKREVRGGTYIAPKSIPTFEAKSIDWFATLAGRRDGTISNYRGVLDNWLLPRFRNVRLDQIDTQTVEKFRAEIDAKTGRGNLKIIMTVLAQILKMAQRHDQIRIVATERLPRLVPKTAELVDDDEPRDTEVLDPEKVLNPAEVASMLESADPGFDRAFLSTCALTGCRDGELLALRWSEVDFTSGKISIERSLSWSRVLPPRALDGTRPAAGPIQPRFYPPKTTTSKRALIVAPQLISLLRVWKLQCPPGKMIWYFPRPMGGRCIGRLRSSGCGPSCGVPSCARSRCIRSDTPSRAR